MSAKLIPVERIESKILLIRGFKVMVDRDLARLYQVPTKRLNEQVKRNIKRFPADFMFQMSEEEFNKWKSHFATSNKEKMGIRKRPFVFTQDGVAMLSSVLNSERAILVNIEIMRTFTKIREYILSHRDLQKKITALEEKYDAQFRAVFDTIRQIEEPLKQRHKRQIGFHVREE